MRTRYLFLLLIVLFIECSPTQPPVSEIGSYPNFSGIYPHLAFYNSQGECGTGAVVPWANKLWAVTYSPHEPNGSDDKLYEISTELDVKIHPESIGGTPANRMIHSESNQLFIGPYAIRANTEVRAIPYDIMMGRHTGNARHLTDPVNKIYYGTMEEGFYEVDVNILSINTLYPDGNKSRKEGQMDQEAELLPGAHGKGLYSGQGVVVYSNNGEAVPEALQQFDIESGALAEWDGKEWIIVRRNQFVEVTGPGGIYGNPNPATDPIWTTGFDHKSLILGVRDHKTGWSFYRLPKASYSYDGAHGWNTEWPRIRNVGIPEKPEYLMTMHGMFWHFPEGFNAENTSGIRPKSAYLKVIGDFTRWNDQLVFGCDDSAQREFLNKRKAKGNIEGPGQSNSNLWFTSMEKPAQLGPNTAAGAVWLNEEIKKNQYSEAFLFTGWEKRSAWIINQGKSDISLSFEIDKSGNGIWEELKQEEIGAGSSGRVLFGDQERGEWIRVKTNNATKISLEFTYADVDGRDQKNDELFKGLTCSQENNASGGLLYGLGENRRALGISAFNKKGNSIGYYELDSAMNLDVKDDPVTKKFIDEKFSIPEGVISAEKSSVLIIDDSGRRWRLPKGSSQFDELINNAQTRICREVATERDLFNCHGTFYELPAENADGFAKIRPIASHDYRIHDYASYRGMLIISGINPNQNFDNANIIKSSDGKLALWAGAIDDLWKMGKPIGKGGPWYNEAVNADIPSDPFLIGFYDQRKLTIKHDYSENVTFTIEVNPIGHGPWMVYKEFTVGNNETHNHVFPRDFEARWVRVISNKDCKATVWFEYW